MYNIELCIKRDSIIDLRLWCLNLALGLFVIKKHFGKLCDSLSNNYQKTVKRLQQLTDLAEEDRMFILSSNDDQLNNPVAVNQRILMYLFMNCQSCDHLMNTCTIIEELTDPGKQLNVNNFQRGKKCMHICMNSTYIHYIRMNYN